MQFSKFYAYLNSTVLYKLIKEANLSNYVLSNKTFVHYCPSKRVLYFYILYNAPIKYVYHIIDHLHLLYPKNLLLVHEKTFSKTGGEDEHPYCS